MSKSVLDRVRKLTALEQELEDCKATLADVEELLEEGDVELAELKERVAELGGRPDVDHADVATLARWAHALLSDLGELGTLSMDERIALDATRRLGCV